VNESGLAEEPSSGAVAISHSLPPKCRRRCVTELPGACSIRKLSVSHDPCIRISIINFITLITIKIASTPALAKDYEIPPMAPHAIVLNIAGHRKHDIERSIIDDRCLRCCKFRWLLMMMGWYNAMSISMVGDANTSTGLDVNINQIS